MRTSPPFGIIFRFPKSDKGIDLLSRKTAEIYADAVIEKIKSLDCSPEQKDQLIFDIIEYYKTH